MPKLGRCQRKKLQWRLKLKVKEQRAKDEQSAVEKERMDLEMEDAVRSLLWGELLHGACFIRMLMTRSDSARNQNSIVHSR